MGKKVICDTCETVFKEELVKDLKACPVCGSPWDDVEDTESKDEELSFGEGVELGENDSFDEDKIDFWWYEVRKPGTLGESDTGDVSTTCAKCGTHSFAPYHIAKEKDYLLIDSRYEDKCSNCGNEMKNHILSKRPSTWVDPREREMWVRDYTNMPKCPICGSVKIHKISMTNKAASALTFGVLALGHISKTYKCDICGSKF